jgi:hypothetical protein
MEQDTITFDDQNSAERIEEHQHNSHQGSPAIRRAFEDFQLVSLNLDATI